MSDFSQLLANTLEVNSQIRLKAEQQLQNISLDIGTMEMLFNFIINSTADIKLKQAAAVFLKEYVSKYWFDDTEAAIEKPNKILSQECKVFYKNNILQLMTSSDPRVAPTLKESIVIICKQAGGYFNAWPELISLLAAHLAQKNYAVSIELYHLIKKIIQRYRIEMKSYDLFEEIKLTIKHIAHIFTEDAVTCSQFLFSEEKNNQAMALSYIKMFRYIMSIFFSINFQDFPEYFEDNLKTWIEILKSGIAFDIPLFNKECLNEVIKLKTAVMKSINLYHNNYYEDIQDYVGEFYPLIWNLAIFVKNEDDYSKLVREILDYYKISFQYRRASGFSNETIQHLIDKLIIPNMQMTRQELDDYEENPTNFLKVELEEADMDSNKYHAINLLKNLINIYPNVTNELIRPMISSLLDEYHKNPHKLYMNKIIAINLIFATMIKTFAQRIGATELKVDPSEIASLIELIFIKEFNNEITRPHQLSRIFSMKFLTTFRLQIPHTWLNSTINMLVQILNLNDPVIQNACLLTLEKILYMKDLNTNVNLAVDAVNDESTFGFLIESLAKFLSDSINIFAIRCYYRTIFLTNEKYYKPIIGLLNTSVGNTLKVVISNPSEDQFNFYLFETIALVMQKLSTFDYVLYSEFLNHIQADLILILNNGITDLLGYVFQIYALQLRLMPSENVNDPLHNNLIQTILFNEEHWTIQMKFLFNPFVQYLKISFLKNRQYFNQVALSQVFKIIDKLLNTLKTYGIVFEIMESVMNSFDYESIKENIKNLMYNFIVTYNNLKETNKKAFKEFGKHFLVFVCKFILQTNAKCLFDLLESISPGSTVGLLAELSELLMDLDNSKNKKLVTYVYCLLIAECCPVFDVNVLKMITFKLVQHLESFYKLNLNRLFGNEPAGAELAYTANSYNKLTNADVKISFNYDNVYSIDETQVFFKAIDTVKNTLNVNLVNEVYENLTNRQKEYVQKIFSGNK